MSGTGGRGVKVRVDETDNRGGHHHIPGEADRRGRSILAQGATVSSMHNSPNLLVDLPTPDPAIGVTTRSNP